MSRVVLDISIKPLSVATVQLGVDKKLESIYSLPSVFLALAF